ncbi:FMN-binding glutamate synthase family protein [Paenactinomyces guangxiensis]|uniref:FMN-binding glutamate synthase family protein n=1 Tax=Paenactinomyces guangxiensis TaxID=1490290 RepID=A0A7W1WTV6_9BACL|nr:FMN-binding glutamate synthase family protein [Paenactinomyces guangxiensis]MBA4495761.1 FMN-binding glutamate synthase family protein [Paenactinomyces guangxiensis]MBH8592750.1 FMN-binding glutamate synthase family protein [Paenactinomyces guangxiensis]
MIKLIKNFARSVINEVVDEAIERLIKDQYIENLFEMVPATKKVNPIYLMELVMRSQLGAPAARPLGSHIHFSPWEKILFNPVHLFRFPTQENVSVQTSVTIGKRAKKPLTISIPIMIAAMSFGGALSKKAKIALARAASQMGTATNSGEAGLLQEEREAAQLFIGQYNRGGWMNTPEKYKQLDAIEIQLGQGAQGSSPQRTTAKNIGPDFREVFELKEGEDAIIHSRLPGVNTKEDFIGLVRRLRDETGVPVGLKFAATHHLEKELEIALEAEVDFITLDGAEGGTHGGAPALQDDVGLPTLYAITRARDFLVQKKAVDDVSLIGTGGLITPGHILKALALGCDAVYIGTSALLAMVGDQIKKTMPFEAPTSLVVYTGKMTDQLDIDQSVSNLVRYLNAAVLEIELVTYSLGKTSLTDINKSDLCTTDPFFAKAAGISFAGVPEDKQSQFFNFTRS